MTLRAREVCSCGASIEIHEHPTDEKLHTWRIEHRCTADRADPPDLRPAPDKSWLETE